MGTSELLGNPNRKSSGLGVTLRWTSIPGGASDVLSRFILITRLRRSSRLSFGSDEPLSFSRLCLSA